MAQAPKIPGGVFLVGNGRGALGGTAAYDDTTNTLTIEHLILRAVLDPSIVFDQSNDNAARLRIRQENDTYRFEVGNTDFSHVSTAIAMSVNGSTSPSDTGPFIAGVDIAGPVAISANEIGVPGAGCITLYGDAVLGSEIGAVALLSTAPDTLWHKTDAAANCGYWAQQVGATTWKLSALGDDLATFKDAVVITRTAIASVKVTLGTSIQFAGYGVGTITSDASGNLTSVSDERLKRDIRPFSRGLNAVLALAPILHGYTEASGLDAQRNDYAGFSAQNVQTVIPEAVGQDKDGYLSLSDRPIIAALVNAVQALTARLEALERR